jgi:hypothetical protein
MRRGAGIGDETRSEAAIGDALDEFIGSWSAGEEKRLLKSIEPFEAVYEDFWK